MVQPGWVRITHWINAVAVVLMVMSGWQIYDASPIFPAIEFPPSITLGGWLAGALQWHFAVMWLAIWKSVQFPLLRTLMGGYDNARVVHFMCMSVLVAFFVIHVAMVALVPRSLLLMLRGR
ncbi:hypothetical protein [Paraburkholderia sp. 40]|uniref:hypothetical protein n=1 Tax=Paraburkholderia sp. 40 TaxID=2991059 RepID=UPI003D1E6387